MKRDISENIEYRTRNVEFRRIFLLLRFDIPCSMFDIRYSKQKQRMRLRAQALDCKSTNVEAL